jgi:cytosine/adenosine deaminase-related metal-dependent hydrolase
MSPSPSSVSYRARWVFPIVAPPIADGVVTISGGKIVRVGTGPADSPLVDLGDVALLPGFVNAHTHLEFSLFDQSFGTPGQSFAAWLKQVVTWRREQPAVIGQESLALQKGLQECRTSGVAAIGEIMTPTFAEVWRTHGAEEPHLLFLELLSLNPERVGPLVALAEEFTRPAAAAAPTGQAMRRGLSPHAPYTVHPEMLQRAVQLSAERRFPIAMHVAESREELELLASQTGPLVELLESLAAWYPASLSPGLLPLDYLQTLSRAHRAVIAHGNYLRGDEIEFLAQYRDTMSVAYCPRTHAHFDHDPHPLVEMLKAGVRVAVGTDSRASNPDLSVWNELKFVRDQYPRLDPAEVLKMGTTSAAEALGLGDSFGSLSPGQAAVLVSLDLPCNNGDPYELLFSAAGCPTRRT